jgi:hypothetical protein
MSFTGLYKSPSSITFKRSNSFLSLGFDKNSLDLACQKIFDSKWLLNTYSIKHRGYLFYGMYKDEQPVGFSIVQLDPFVTNVYEIDIFCAQKGYGKYLMRFIQKDLCASKCSIILSSVPSAFEFYRKMGFQKEFSNIFKYVTN